MSYFPDHRPVKLHPAIIAPAVAALVFSLAVIHFSSLADTLWPLGAVIILAHTVLFYRLGRLSERARAQSSPDFLRGLGLGLRRRSD